MSIIAWNFDAGLARLTMRQWALAWRGGFGGDRWRSLALAKLWRDVSHGQAVLVP